MQLHRGFTLIELLVVLVVIALFAGMIMMTITPNNGRTLERETKRLVHVIQLAQDEAILQGIELGLTVSESDYYFLRLQDNNWITLTADRIFKKYSIDPIIKMNLQIEDENNVRDVDDTEKLPSIMILSSGELTSFELNLSIIDTMESELSIIGQENGQLSIKSLYE